MPDTKKNALAELAKRINPKGNDFLYFLIDYDDLYKAASIISKLARVKVEVIKEHPTMVRDAFINLMAKCRAIAEKGEVKR